MLCLPILSNMNTEMPLSKCKENNHILIRIHGRKKYTYSGVDESSAMVCYCCLIRFTMELMHLECHGKRMPKLFLLLTEGVENGSLQPLHML